MGEILPQEYDDATLDSIQSSGGTLVLDLDSIFLKMSLQADSKNSVINVVDGFTFHSSEELHKENRGFEQLAARQLILHLVKGTTSKNWLHVTLSVSESTLETVHQLAKSVGVVSSYSSLMWTANDAMLKQEIKDRFKRTVEPQAHVMSARTSVQRSTAPAQSASIGEMLKEEVEMESQSACTTAQQSTTPAQSASIGEMLKEEVEMESKKTFVADYYFVRAATSSLLPTWSYVLFALLYILL